MTQPREIEQLTRRGANRGRNARRSPLVGALLAALLFAGVAVGQIRNPVYVDDSPAAAEALDRAVDLAESGNLDEAAAVLQSILDADTGRVIQTAGDADLFTTARRRVHATLLEHPELLERYRRSRGAEAKRMLEAGEDERVEQTRLLTDAGFEAALRVAQRRLERGRFHAALRTLRQLEPHPTRLRRAREAAEMAALVASYVGRDAAWSLADRWRREAGLEPLPEQRKRRAPAPPRREGVSSLDAGPSIDISEMVSKPFWSEDLTVEAPEAERDRNRESQDEVSERARLLHIVPTAAGDLIYVNDGQSVSAWDRFTLSMRWRVLFRPLPEDVRSRLYASGRRGITDLNTVTVSGPWALTVTGIAAQGQRFGDGRLHALDSRTGELRWSVDLPALSAELENSEISGPLVLDGGIVIATVVKQNRQRRLASVNLIGLDVGSGQLLWRASLGSTGQLAYPTSSTASEAVAVDDGVAYFASRLGFVAAVETATGRTLWIRRFESEAGNVPSAPAWEVSAPIVREDAVAFISPDGRSISVVDKQTGETLGRRASGELGHLAYLLPAQDRIVVVADGGVWSIPWEDLLSPDMPPTSVLKISGVRGRVVVAGDQALAPSIHGVWVAPVQGGGGAETSYTPLDRPGNVLPLDGQLVVVDDASVHSYLIWTMAEEMLAERMEAFPDRATPAATYAELAFRAGRIERVLPAVDAALDAIERAPLDPENRAARGRLFEAVMAMVDPDPSDDEAATIAEPIQAALLERAASLASKPEERARSLLARGALSEAGDSPVTAAQRYQRILDEPSLATATVERHGATLDAEAEATRRLRSLLRRFGREIYARFEAEAERALATAEDGMDPEAFTAIARRYPIARSAPKAWLRASEAFAQRGRPLGTIYALDQGLQAAEDALSPNDPLVGELAGRLVRTLARAGRVSAASATLQRLLEARPDLTLTESGSPIDAASLLDSLADQMAARNRRPRVGLVPPTPNVEAIEGWTLLDAVLEIPTAASAEFAPMVSRTRAEFGLFGIDPAGGVRQLWSTDFDEEDGYLTMTDDAVFLTEEGPEGVAVVRYDLATGRRNWSSQAFHAALPVSLEAEDRLRRPDGDGVATITTPLRERRLMSDLLTATDGRTLALVERTGRAVAFDLETGRTLWATNETAPAVYGIEASGGLLVIGGAAQFPEQGRGELEHDGLALAIDLRTGRTLHRLPVESGAVRWVRMTPEGHAVIGMHDGVASFDLFQGRRRWLVRGVAGEETEGAWVFPQRLIVLDQRGRAWQIESETGRTRPEPLTMEGRLRGALGPVVSQTLDDRAALASADGVTLIAPDGRIAGMDRRPSNVPLASASFGENYVFAIEVAATDTEPNIDEYQLYAFTTRSLALTQRRGVALWAKPVRLDLLDGRILITAGDATIVLDAPTPD